MRRLVGAEALKLRSTRTTAALALGALALVALVTAATALTVDADEPDAGGVLLAAPGIAQAFALLLGVLAVTTELRHGTMTPTLLVTPARGRVLAAKLVVHAAWGVALGLLAFLLAVAIALPVLASRDVPSGLGAGDVVAIVAGGALGTALFAGLGVGIGAVVGNQVGAVVGALGWLYVVEQGLAVVPGLGDVVRRIGLAGLSSGLSATASPDPDVELLAQVPAALLLSAYLALLVAAGAVLLRRRDVAT